MSFIGGFFLGAIVGLILMGALISSREAEEWDDYPEDTEEVMPHDARHK